MNVQINPSTNLIMLLASDILAVGQNKLKQADVAALEKSLTNPETGHVQFVQLIRELSTHAGVGTVDGMWRIAAATLAGWDAIVDATISDDQKSLKAQLSDQISTNLIMHLLELKKLRSTRHPGILVNTPQGLLDLKGNKLLGGKP